MDETPNWAKQLIADVNELKNQISTNCTKLDNFETTLTKMDTKLDSIVEIVTANGQGIEVLSGRIDKLEK